MEEEFRSRNQMTTSRNTLQHFAFIEVTLTQEPRASGHSDIHRTKSKVKYFLAWTKKHFFLSIGLDNGQEEKNMGTFIFFTAVWNGTQITCGSKYRHTIRRFAIIQPSVFYFSLRIS